MKKLFLIALFLSISTTSFAQFGVLTGSTECATSACDLHSATTLNEQSICLADGTNCPGSGGGDAITVNTTAIDTTADFADNIYMDFTVTDGGAGGPDTVNSKFNYNAATGDHALSVNEGAFASNGFVFEGATADTIELYIAVPDPVTTDKTLTLPNATDTLVGRDTTDTFTNKTIDTTNTVTINASDITDQNAGTDITADLEEETHASEHASGGGDAVDHDTLTNFVSNEHIDHTSVTLTAGAGLSGGGDISANRSFATASGEANFLASGALTCGASTQGKIQVHTTPLQYCDNAATPALQYAAYADSAGLITNFSNANDLDSAGDVANDSHTHAAGNITGTNAGTDLTADLEEEGVTCTGCISSADIEDAAVVTGDIAADTITHANIVDSDQTDTKGFVFFEADGIDDTDDLQSIWSNRTANAFQVTEIWCETDTGTVTAMLQLDDGTPADCDTVDLVCAATAVEDTALDGDCLVSSDEQLDWAITTTASTPTFVRVFFTGNWVD